MQKIYCKCCGYEITIRDRYCPNCSENNDLYVEEGVILKTTPSPIYQPINRVPIHTQGKLINNITEWYKNRGQVLGTWPLN